MLILQPNKLYQCPFVLMAPRVGEAGYQCSYGSKGGWSWVPVFIWLQGWVRLGTNVHMAARVGEAGYQCSYGCKGGWGWVPVFIWLQGWVRLGTSVHMAARVGEAGYQCSYGSKGGWGWIPVFIWLQGWVRLDTLPPSGLVLYWLTYIPYKKFSNRGLNCSYKNVDPLLQQCSLKVLNVVDIFLV